MQAEGSDSTTSSTSPQETEGTMEPREGEAPSADLPAESEALVVAKPRRTGLTAEIREIETADVSLREPSGTCVMQGDLLRDVTFAEDVFEKPIGVLRIPQITLPYVIVLSQACDLQNAKCLLSVLVAPLYNAEHFFEQKHLSELGQPDGQRLTETSSGYKRIVQNNDPRYHYLEFPDGVQLPKGVIDFRHYCTLNVRYLSSIRREQLVWSLPPLWRESVSQRFAAFLARIGLPQSVPPPDLDDVNRALAWPKKA